MSFGNLLVVGGTGFIGRHLVKLACEYNYNVVVLSSKKHVDQAAAGNIGYNAGNVDYDTGNIDYAVGNIDYIVADIRDYSSLKKVLSGREINYVVNLGGYIDHTKFMSGGYAVIDAHFNGVLNLVRCLDWSKIKGFVQIGSSDEYGNLPAPQSENQRERPISSYSLAKLASNHFLQMLHREEGFPVVLLRLFLVYGPGQNIQRFIPQVIQGCLNRETFPVSFGEQLRDFCYVKDIVQGIFSAMKCPVAMGKVINLASGNPVRIRDIIELIHDKIGTGCPMYGKLKYRKGENMALYADISRAEKFFNWHPCVELTQGIEETIGFYRRLCSNDR